MPYHSYIQFNTPFINIFMNLLERQFVIFIVGTTAVGKTKLSVELSKAIGGEVINCDSKQLYKYANIMTAKATQQQTQGVPHHMLDVLELQETCYNRNKYFLEAMKTINDIKSRGKIPVVVGGTNYYLQTLLYDINMGFNIEEEKGEQLQKQKPDNQQKKNREELCRLEKQKINKMTIQEKYNYLRQVDPVMGNKIHKNDETRVNSFLNRYAQTGQPPSSSYKPLVHNLRSKDCILFWIRNSEKKQLHELMQKRINSMVDQGGLAQILSVFKYMEIHGYLSQKKTGVLQSIGYKQFQDVYNQIKQILDESLKNQSKEPCDKVEYEKILKKVKEKQEEIQKKLEKTSVKSIRSRDKITLLQKCKQILTKNTIDYAKRQVTWLRNRIFASESNRANFFVLQLNNGNIKKSLNKRFQENVKNKALEIWAQISQHGLGTIQQNSKEFQVNQHETIFQWKKYHCDKCNVQLNGSREWKEHQSSKKHKNMLSKKERKALKKSEKLERNDEDSNFSSSEEDPQQHIQKQKQDNRQEQQLQQQQEQQQGDVSKRKVDK